ncbi:phage tail protein [Cereibacter sphaeroides]|uniref:phage tail protein n=1 Tax=Cereibacter sphaeroides TaxID=1063 RepID=UPI001F402542|nr:phage tail protein [Cereibacter sphaeroides]MCE6960577.1 phage tail protein [Cereibacter sphaeroides]MCE6972742.1 phage tail protein [Cereibacter sphaeroides]
MLLPTAGGRLFVSGLPVLSWTEIAHVEALGAVGIEWDTEHAAYFADNEERQELTVFKTQRRPTVMQIVMGIEAADPGQLILWQAARSFEEYAFRLTFPGATVVRNWRGLVTACREVFDTANSVIRLQADLHVGSYDREATTP